MPNLNQGYTASTHTEHCAFKIHYFYWQWRKSATAIIKVLAEIRHFFYDVRLKKTIKH